jgi:uncharacterized phage-associated protein
MKMNEKLPSTVEDVVRLVIANCFEMDCHLTSREIHKILYLADGWHLLVRGKRLIDDTPIWLDADVMEYASAVETINSLRQSGIDMQSVKSELRENKQLNEVIRATIDFYRQG